ncbi:MAG: MotA/TolQ/ExbB proton channel family protein [Acidobacteriota bacterium]
MRSLIDIFQSGGPIMVPLLLCSILALAIIIEKLINLRLPRIVRPGSLAAIKAFVERNQIEPAVEFCRHQPGIFNNIIRHGLEHYEFGREEVKEAIQDAGRQEMPRLERYLGILGTLVGVSPLLGLLGTVGGMIKVFNVIAEVGVGRANALAGGISEALITTVTGLVIAIPSLIMYNIFRGRAELIVVELERHSTELIRSLFARQPRAARTAAAPPTPPSLPRQVS